MITASQIQWTADVTKCLLTAKERGDKKILKVMKKKQVGSPPSLGWAPGVCHGGGMRWSLSQGHSKGALWWKSREAGPGGLEGLGVRSFGGSGSAWGWKPVRLGRSVVRVCLSCPLHAPPRHLVPQVSVLNKYSEAIRGNLTKIMRLKIVALVTIEVHARDVLEKLYKSGLVDLSSFEWLSQLRFYWEKVRPARALLTPRSLDLALHSVPSPESGPARHFSRGCSPWVALDRAQEGHGLLP